MVQIKPGQIAKSGCYFVISLQFGKWKIERPTLTEKGGEVA